jgi:two-component system, cell cycle response regulator
MKDKPVILVVDDQPQNIELLEAYLVPQGYEVVTAASGEEALAKAAAVPDLILLDVMMPKMSGIEVLAKLRATETTRLIPVVMVTALKELEDRVKALEAGCDDFITKPFDKVEMLARVKSMLRIGYYRRQLDEKEKFAAVIQAMGDGVVVCSPDWVITELNASAAKYLNVEGGKGKNLLDLFFNGFLPTLARAEIAKADKTFDLVRAETEQVKAFYLEARLDLIKAPDGKITNLVASLRDVTEKRLENQLKADFLSLISHKLKTPLTGAMQNIELLKGNIFGSLSDRQMGVVVAVSRDNQKLNRLFDRLIFFVATGQSRPKQAKGAAALGSAIEKCRQQIREVYPDKKINLNSELPNDLPPVSISEIDLNNLLFELADNAVKFNDKPEVNIVFSAKLEPPGFVSLVLSDNGVGIPAENYDRIFDRFNQVEKYFTGQVEGLGLGLPLAKKLVEAVGGKIRVESAGEGKGTKLCFTLPVG